MNQVSAYNLIEDKLWSMLSSDFTITDEIELHDNCEMCKRTPNTFDYKGYIWKDSYKTDNYICKTCMLFCEQFPNTIGIERGNIGYKLSSFKGAKLTIPMDRNLPAELWIGGKYLDRVVDDTPFKIQPFSGNESKYKLAESIGEYSVVVELSLRRELFLENIRLSNEQNMYVATETGCIALNKDEYQSLKKAFLNEDMSKKQSEEFFVVIRGFKTGRLSVNNKRLQELLASLSPATRKILMQIANPHSLLFYIDALKGSY